MKYDTLVFRQPCPTLMEAEILLVRSHPETCLLIIAIAAIGLVYMMQNISLN